jgi:hypothetical protein
MRTWVILWEVSVLLPVTRYWYGLSLCAACKVKMGQGLVGKAIYLDVSWALQQTA